MNAYHTMDCVGAGRDRESWLSGTIAGYWEHYQCVKETKKGTKMRRRKHIQYFKFVVLQDSPSPIALEPCNGNRAAVLSLLVRLPTGKRLKSFL